MFRIFCTGLLLLPVLAGCNRSQPAPKKQPPVAEKTPAIPESARHQPEGHQRMLTRLREIDDQVRKENIYLGASEAIQLREELARMSSSPATAAARCRLLLRLGIAELRLGNEQDALDRLSEARELLQDDQVRKQVGQDQSLGVLFHLGVTSMRIAETLNCCQRNTPDSCILPIRGEGIHTVREPAENAIGYFTEVLEAAPAESDLHYRARWLLNIAAMTLGDYPDQVPPAYLIPPESFRSDEEFPRFVNISSRLGINTFSLSGGAVADDFDGDDYIDLVVSTWDPAGQIRFFHNNGDGTFEERTVEAGLEGLVGGLNIVQADYDNDGDPDLYVLRGAWFGTGGAHPNSLIRNNGDGTFTDVTFDARLGYVHYPTQTASWADYDNDGDLDLYVGNEHGRGGTALCQLFQNNGDGTFAEVGLDAGVTNQRYAKAVIWGDYNHDRWPDLYVSNLGGENRLYRNNADGTFTDVAGETGVALPLGSFPAWFWDIDNDGGLDLFVSSYSNAIEQLAASCVGADKPMELARLYRNDGSGSFEEVASQWNLSRPSTPMGSNFGDIDHDGYPDFYLGTGDPEYYNLMPNVMYRNRQGQGFSDVTMDGGFGHLQKGHAVVFADFDNDGDQDIFEQLGGAFPGDGFQDALFENPGFGNNWIGVHLVGTTSNRSAIGARLKVDIRDADRTRTVYRHVNSGGTFGANPLRQQIGLGQAEQVDRLEVFWPTTGETQVFVDVPANGWIRITEGESDYKSVDVQPFRFAGSGDSRDAASELP